MVIALREDPNGSAVTIYPHLDGAVTATSQSLYRTMIR
jgi:hypothetical protein